MFNAATCWWADGLSEPPGYVRPAVYNRPKGPDRRVQRITADLLDRFRTASPRPRHPPPTSQRSGGQTVAVPEDDAMVRRRLAEETGR